MDRDDAHGQRATGAGVPCFAGNHPLVVMDGECTLCTVGARLIARFDRRARFRIAPVQSPLGQALLKQHALVPEDPESWLLLIDGQAFTGMDAIIRAGREVGGVGLLLQPLRLLPARLRDWIYRRIARNRYMFFGRTDMCAVPDPRLRARLVS